LQVPQLQLFALQAHIIPLREEPQPLSASPFQQATSPALLEPPHSLVRNALLETTALQVAPVAQQTTVHTAPTDPSLEQPHLQTVLNAQQATTVQSKPQILRSVLLVTTVRLLLQLTTLSSVLREPSELTQDSECSQTASLVPQEDTALRLGSGSQKVLAMLDPSVLEVTSLPSVLGEETSRALLVSQEATAQLGPGTLLVALLVPLTPFLVPLMSPGVFLVRMDLTVLVLLIL
jgi:hypothetical protein